MLTIVSERCPLRKQNLDYAMYLLNVLVSESRVRPNNFAKQQLHIVCVLCANRAEFIPVIDTSSFCWWYRKLSRGRMRNAKLTWKNMCGKGASLSEHWSSCWNECRTERKRKTYRRSLNSTLETLPTSTMKVLLVCFLFQFTSAHLIWHLFSISKNKLGEDAEKYNAYKESVKKLLGLNAWCSWCCNNPSQNKKTFN